MGQKIPKVKFEMSDLLTKVELSTLNCCIIDTLEVKGSTVPHCKVLRFGKYEAQGLSFV